MSEKKTTHPLTAGIITVPWSIRIALLIALAGGLFFISPYLGAVMFSALIAYIYNPVYKSLLRLTKRAGIAITGTLLTIVLSVMLPIAIVASVTIHEATALVSNVSSSNVKFGSADIQRAFDDTLERTNDALRGLPGGESLQIDRAQVNNTFKNIALGALSFLTGSLQRAGSAAVDLISTTILAVFLIIGMLRHQDRLIATIKNLSPYDDKLNNLYLTRAGHMTTAMVKGQFVVALAQGFASALSLWIVGIDYFWFFFVLLTFLSFIPLGAGIVTIPLAIVLLLTGQIWQGIFLLIFHFLVVSFIDNLLRPRLVPKDAALNDALLLLGVFSGLALFGAAGVIYGPVVMILIVTTVYIYSVYNRKVEKISLPSNDIK
ncbi:AI-2E family transporter [Candidatus Saccharibacteria bacterium]|nr:AI-2E family transporter [Candidatus Saccharibacteria bacterium]